MGIDKTDLAAELGEFAVGNKSLVKPWVYGKSKLLEFCKPLIRGVQGEYKVPSSITGHLVQLFTGVWNASGTTYLMGRKLISYHQIVNYILKPSDVYDTWIGDLYNENLTREQQPIAKYIMEKEVLPKAADDICILVATGIYNAGTPHTFGASMNGVVKVIGNGKVDTDHPMFIIPTDPITDSNAREQVIIFERGIPESFRNKVKRIFMGTDTFASYKMDNIGTFVYTPNMVGEMTIKTPIFGYDIIAIPELAGTGLMFATVEDNMFKLVGDIENPPMVTDVQIADYDVKLFMEWTLGIDFGVNECVFVNDTSGDYDRGLNDAGKNTLYYPGEDL